MKTLTFYSKRTCHKHFTWFIVCLSLLFSLSFPSCQKLEDDYTGSGANQMSDMTTILRSQDNSENLYYGPETFKRFHKAPYLETRKIENPESDKFGGNFILRIKNGSCKKDRVSSAEIRIDGKLVICQYDFNKNVSLICRKVTGLTPGSILTVRLNGSPGSFIVLWIEGTRIAGEVTDIDGNTYKTLKIGDQWWMKENLKVTKYNNGDLIGTTIPANLNISAESTPKYQWAFKGNEGYAVSLGRLYTWYAVTDSRGICPVGWRVPSDEDWSVLTGYLINNGFGYEGSGPDIGKAVASASGWRADPTPGNAGNNQENNNSSGFTGLPGGDRLSTGVFINLGAFAGWWSSTESTTLNAWYRGIFYNISGVNRSNDSKKFGGAVRCIRN